MADSIMMELWRIKDEIAMEHGYDIERLVAYLISKRQSPLNSNGKADSEFIPRNSAAKIEAGAAGQASHSVSSI